MTGEEFKKKALTIDPVIANIARNIGMSSGSLNNMLGRPNMTTGLLEKFCKAYNVNMSLFYPEIQTVNSFDINVGDGNIIQKNETGDNTVNQGSGVSSEEHQKLQAELLEAYRELSNLRKRIDALEQK